MTGIRINSTEINITWADVPETHKNGVIRSFVVLLHEANGTLNTSRNLTVIISEVKANNIYWKVITGIGVLEEYVIKVAAVTIARGEFSQPVLVPAAKISKCYNMT